MRYPRFKCVFPSRDNAVRRRERGGCVYLNALPEIVKNFILQTRKKAWLMNHLAMACFLSMLGTNGRGVPILRLTKETDMHSYVL